MTTAFDDQDGALDDRIVRGDHVTEPGCLDLLDRPAAGLEARDIPFLHLDAGLCLEQWQEMAEKAGILRRRRRRDGNVLVFRRDRTGATTIRCSISATGNISPISSPLV